MTTEGERDEEHAQYSARGALLTNVSGVMARRISISTDIV
jgi:hypothetical protein